MSQPPQAAFNLLDEPWIPVRTLSGVVTNASLTEVLLNARTYAGVAVTSPPAFVALHRVLLAMVHRALTMRHARWSDNDRARWYRDGFPETALRAYLGEWRERFWLFHPTNPFMQVAALATCEKTRDKVKPWTQIALEAANGNAPVLFAHSLDHRPDAISYADACLHLLGFLQFTPGGLVKVLRTSDKAGPLANTAAVLPLGTTLLESLVLALHPFDARRPDDRPAWESDATTVEELAADATVAAGYDDAYTRLSRSVLLLPESDGYGTRYLLFAEGVALEQEDTAPDPMVCYRINKDGKPVRVTFREGRAVWRDLPALLPDPVRAQDVPPSILGWAANLHQTMGLEGTTVGTVVAGVTSDQAKLVRWRMERLNLPSMLLTNPAAAQELRRLIRLADERFSLLRSICADMIASTMPDASHKDTRSRARSAFDNGPAASAYFSTVERAVPALMQRIAAEDIEAAWTEWSNSLIAAAEQGWTATRRSVGDSAKVFRAEALVRPRYAAFLSSLRLTASDAANEETPA